MATIAVIFFWDKLPYQSALSSQLSRILREKGIVVNTLEVQNFSQTGAEIANSDFGADKHLLIKNLRAEYDLQQLVSKQKISALYIEGLQLNAYQNNRSFLLGGVEKLLEKEAEPSVAKSEIDFAALLNLAPDKLQIHNSVLEAELDAGRAKIPFTMDFNKAETPSILLQSAHAELSAKNKNISAENLKIDAKYNAEKKEIAGILTAENIAIAADEESELPEIPPLKLRVDFAVAAENFSAKIDLSNTDKKWKLLANLDVPLSNPKLATAQILQAKLPYAKGEVSTKIAKLPLDMSKAIVAELALQNVDLNELMQKVSDGKISGSGTINGKIPLKYYPDGRLEFGNGELKTAESGVISVAPEMLAGDNEQMQITRTALENFNYTILKIGVSSKDGKMLINLNMQGNNPDAFSGKAIKLNVNLSGDVLPLIQQSILPINDIKQLLKMKEAE